MQFRSQIVQWPSAVRTHACQSSVPFLVCQGTPVLGCTSQFVSGSLLPYKIGDILNTIGIAHGYSHLTNWDAPPNIV